MPADSPAVPQLDRLLERRLVRRASAVRLHAYAPYSRYLVGAAVLTESGSIYSGSNIENASYGLTICAERSALFAAASGGHRRIRAVAIVTESDPPAAPCGACRQVLNEFAVQSEQSGTIVLLATPAGTILRRYRLAELLPAAFGPGDLRTSGDA